jgi:hypothetical protein
LALSSLRRLVETTPLRPLTRECVAVAPRGRGVYAILDREEPEAGQIGVGRVVRIGVAESQTLSDRLSDQVGNADGDGKHRRSAFRRHVGWAVARRDDRQTPTWSVKPAPHGARTT